MHRNSLFYIWKFIEWNITAKEEENLKTSDIELISESFKILSGFVASLRDNLYDYLKNKNIEFLLLKLRSDNTN